MNIFQKMKLKGLQKKVQVLYNKRERGDNVDVKFEIKAQLDLAHFYDKHFFDAKLPNAEIYALECYRAAALLGSPEAQYIFGQRQMEKGKFWSQWAAGMYGRAIHKKYAQDCYEEAFNYLEKSEAGGYPLAKRLRGLALINGWGVAKDKDRGFKLIVASIEDEKAWDRAMQIFTDLGLNTPEFFSSIVALKANK